MHVKLQIALYMILQSVILYLNGNARMEPASKKNTYVMVQMNTVITLDGILTVLMVQMNK